MCSPCILTCFQVIFWWASLVLLIRPQVVFSVGRMLSVQFSCSVISNSLRPHGLQHGRLPYPSPSPEACSNSCPLSRWCHPTIWSSVVPFSSCLHISQHQGLFNESTLCMRWPKYWSFSFSISPSREYSGLISFRIDWLDLLAVKGTLKSLLQHHNLKALVLRCSVFFIVQLSHPVHDYWRNHSFDLYGPLSASNVSAF